MKIISLLSENFKKLKAVEIIPGDKSTVVISGKNGQGKSSILDSIFVALGGKPSDLTKPIRDGEEKATIRIELDDYYVIRTFKQGSTKLEVVSKDGELMSSPQSFLDKLIGKLSFDPLAFQNMKEKEQRATLLQLTNLDLDGFTQKRQKLYDQRHEEGVLMSSYPELTISEVTEAERIVKEGPISLTLTTQAIVEAQAILNQQKDNQQQITYLSQRIEETNKKIAELEKEKMKLAEDLTVAFATETKLKETPIIDIAKAQEDIQRAEEKNARYSKAESLLKQNAAKKEIKAVYDKLTQEMEALDKERDEKLQTAQMPIPGLSVTDDNVIYNKIPFSQLSSAEKLKISMAIAMAMNPELRVIRITDGSLLDDDNMTVIKEMAGEKDFQVWIEKVDSSGKVGFYIEEGEVKAINE